VREEDGRMALLSMLSLPTPPTALTPSSQQKKEIVFSEFDEIMDLAHEEKSEEGGMNFISKTQFCCLALAFVSALCVFLYFYPNHFSTFYYLMGEIFLISFTAWLGFVLLNSSSSNHCLLTPFWIAFVILVGLIGYFADLLHFHKLFPPFFSFLFFCSLPPLLVSIYIFTQYQINAMIFCIYWAIGFFFIPFIVSNLLPLLECIQVANVLSIFIILFAQIADIRSWLSHVTCEWLLLCSSLSFCICSPVALQIFSKSIIRHGIYLFLNVIVLIIGILFPSVPALLCVIFGWLCFAVMIAQYSEWIIVAFLGLVLFVCFIGWWKGSEVLFDFRLMIYRSFGRLPAEEEENLIFLREINSDGNEFVTMSMNLMGEGLEKNLLCVSEMEEEEEEEEEEDDKEDDDDDDDDEEEEDEV
jgi:hypothetical protein